MARIAALSLIAERIFPATRYRRPRRGARRSGALDGKIARRAMSGRTTARICMPGSKDAAASRHLDGQRQRLGHHAARGRPARGIRYPVRGQGSVGASPSRRDLRVRGKRARPRASPASLRALAAPLTSRESLAAKTTLPVLGVPIPSKYLRGEDSLLSTVQMPKGIPVATFAIGEAGAANAALFAVAMLALHDAKLGQEARAIPCGPVCRRARKDAAARQKEADRRR